MEARLKKELLELLSYHKEHGAMIKVTYLDDQTCQGKVFKIITVEDNFLMKTEKEIILIAFNDVNVVRDSTEDIIFLDKAKRARAGGRDRSWRGFRPGK